MGQGLFTKIAQIASQELKIPIELIRIGESSTDKTANQTTTAGSTGTDIHGSAVLNGCKILFERIKPFRLIKDNNSLFSIQEFKEVIKKAYNERIPLQVLGSWKGPEDKPFPPHYFTYGVGLSEVELDLLTGNFKIIRSDLIMDVGKSINPMIDIGQIEGAFIQGLGLTTIEEFFYGDDFEHNFAKKGHIYTNAEKYKIPTISDIPKDFRVYLYNHNNGDLPQAILMNSKGIGEPPFSLGFTVYSAIKDIILKEKQFKFIQIDSPLTVSNILTSLKK